MEAIACERLGFSKLLYFGYYDVILIQREGSFEKAFTETTLGMLLGVLV